MSLVYYFQPRGCLAFACKEKTIAQNQPIIVFNIRHTHLALGEFGSLERCFACIDILKLWKMGIFTLLNGFQTTQPTADVKFTVVVSVISLYGERLVECNCPTQLFPSAPHELQVFFVLRACSVDKAKAPTRISFSKSGTPAVIKLSFWSRLEMTQQRNFPRSSQTGQHCSFLPSKR